MVTDKLNPYQMLIGERILLRKLKLSDAEAFFAAASDAEVTKYVNWSPQKSAEESEAILYKLIEKWEEGKSFPWAVARKEDDKLIGVIELMPNPVRPRAEIGYWLGLKHWGKGYMTEAVKLLCRFALTELGLVRIQATHSVENPASGRVMEKAGMTFEGVLRQYSFHGGQSHDAKMYSILKDEIHG